MQDNWSIIVFGSDWPQFIADLFVYLLRKPFKHSFLGQGARSHHILCCRHSSLFEYQMNKPTVILPTSLSVSREVHSILCLSIYIFILLVRESLISFFTSLDSRRSPLLNYPIY